MCRLDLHNFAGLETVCYIEIVSNEWTGPNGVTSCVSHTPWSHFLASCLLGGWKTEQDVLARYSSYSTS
jgi:hypothetical protein